MSRRKSDFETDHIKFHKGHKKRDKNISELEKFHDHSGDDIHTHVGNAYDEHKFHTGHRFALVGNPNCGKTTLFNYLTGSSQYVGNWPGVTVEKKEGRARMGGENLSIVDLPGIYSMSPYSPEEIVSRNYIIDEKPELIINVVDATNIERNLYLTTQLLELGRPMIIALNMFDMVKARGDKIDIKLLSSFLGVPVIPIAASKGEGVMELMHKAHLLAEENTVPGRVRIYSGETEQAIESIAKKVCRVCSRKNMPVFWTAVRLFENDPITVKRFGKKEPELAEIEEIRNSAELDENIDHEIIIADQRYKFITSVCEQTVTKGKSDDEQTVSDRIDVIVTNRVLAIPVFLLIMLTVFYVTFGPLGSYLTDVVDGFISGPVYELLEGFLYKIGTSEILTGLLCDGVLTGVGAVLAFLPQITLLFFFLSILEDSGYMSRAAFVMDQLLRKIGLSGKSFVPMLMGFGCTVPAVMGTRTLENDKDRRLTILLIPFMSCSAKMPVYSMIITAFFEDNRPLIIFSVYLLGIVLAVITGLIFKKTILKGEPAAFVMELPPYRVPTFRSLMIHIWERLSDFISKAGTVILAATAVIWFLQSFDFNLKLVDDSGSSILSSIGKFIAPVFVPCGFGEWQTVVSLLTGVIAKEQVVSTMSVLYGSAGIGLTEALHGIMSPLGAFSFLTFVLIYTPCFAAVATICREMKSRKWAAFCIVYQIAVAWIVSASIYTIGTAMGF